MVDTAQMEVDDFKPTKLYHVRIVRLGIAHFVLGFITVAIGIFDISFSSVAFDVFPTARIATGIWVGGIVLLTGAIGVVTSRSELRRRTTGFLFIIFSIICWLLSVVLMGIAVSEIASSEFSEGMIESQKQLLNGSDCLNLTVSDRANATTPSIRCVATTTFDQKLVADSLLLACGYLESLVAMFAVITCVSIRSQNSATNQNLHNIAMSEMPDPPPGMSVSEYFEERLRHQNAEQSHSRDNQRPRDRIYADVNDAPSNLHGCHDSPSSRDFPDSDQFRSHLEILEGSIPADVGVREGDI